MFCRFKKTAGNGTLLSKQFNAKATYFPVAFAIHVIISDKFVSGQ
jgi:hypothetical protein